MDVGLLVSVLTLVSAFGTPLVGVGSRTCTTSGIAAGRGTSTGLGPSIGVGASVGIGNGSGTSASNAIDFGSSH